jgi:hypothetical protein
MLTDARIAVPLSAETAPLLLYLEVDIY